jgi:hypothetical protein
MAKAIMLATAIVWPLTNDQTNFKPYTVYSGAREFPENLRRQLQGHVSDILAELSFTNQETLKQARRFVSYAPKHRDNDDTKYVADTFCEIVDALAREIDNPRILAQWRVEI